MILLIIIGTIVFFVLGLLICILPFRYTYHYNDIPIDGEFGGNDIKEILDEFDEDDREPHFKG